MTTIDPVLRRTFIFSSSSSIEMRYPHHRIMSIHEFILEAAAKAQVLAERGGDQGTPDQGGQTVADQEGNRPWYTRKSTPAFTDILTTLRKESMREYFLSTPQWTLASRKIIRLFAEALRIPA